ncbi:low molecular weight phosphatase family protein [Streptomyces actuosus]|uniref:Low molecular weight phosphatase family protein n=1 Tax=Streptomyces actuosus TaxID=1885 RepID=A0ABS2W1A3_STRAS|nr:low molecular weight phosphatase family protein [Streptomyces actuosus]MBN0049168.1 low molecular weight phosphatase family protein [Streptomyces actuosus]
MIRILFVCTGNVHRSVLAERLMAARLPPSSRLVPESAGTQAWHRSGMDHSTRAVLEELGGDGSGFVSRPLTPQLVAGAGLVLGLAREHREAAVRLAPRAMRRCFTLMEFLRLAAGAGELHRPTGGFGALVTSAAALRGVVPPVPPAEDDIADPWGRPRQDLHHRALQIDGAVSGLARLWQDSGAIA